MRLSVVLGALVAGAVGSSLATAQEYWVDSVRTSSEWAVFPCTDWLVTSVCGTDKDYSDPGTLPAVVSAGDTVTYTDKKGRAKQFTVRRIRMFIFDADVDTTYGGQRLRAKRGDTTCTFYDVRSRADTADTKYPSIIVVKECRAVR